MFESNFHSLQRDYHKVKYYFQLCRNKCNSNRNCKSFMHEPHYEKCYLMALPIEELQQKHMEFGAYKNCSVLFDPCVSNLF